MLVLLAVVIGVVTYVSVTKTNDADVEQQEKTAEVHDAGEDKKDEVTSRSKASTDAAVVIDESHATELVNDWIDANAALAEAVVDEFCRSVEKAKWPNSDPNPGPNDAREFMQGKVDLEGIPPTIGALHLADPLVEELRSFGDEWPLKIEVRHLRGLDFTWLQKLHNYNRWSQPNDEAVNYARMKWWVELRLAQGLLANDFVSAWNDVEHFANLLASRNDLVALISGYRFMQLAQLAREVAKQRKLAVPESSVDYEELEKLARAAPSFFYPRVSSSAAAKASKCYPMSCAVIAEADSMRRHFVRFGKGPDLDVKRCGINANANAMTATEAVELLIDDSPLRPFVRP